MPVEIWFQDEARVGQKGSLSYVWSPVGSRPPMVRDNRHDTAYIFGAICPARGVGAAVITPAANTECMNLHLAEISTQVAPGSIAALVCDGAGWHQSRDELKLPDNIVLVPLPPYSPELNPMENVWDYFQQTISRRLGQLRRDTGRLRRRLELVYWRPKPHPINRHQRMGDGQCLGVQSRSMVVQTQP